MVGHKSLELVSILYSSVRTQIMKKLCELRHPSSGSFLNNALFPEQTLIDFNNYFLLAAQCFKKVP